MKRLWAVSALLCTVGQFAHAGDYFLTGAQKKELVVRGQMHDEQDRLYDVWIVPGYVVPGRNVREGWHKAGDILQEYGKPKFYNDIGKFSHDTWNFGRRQILRDFAVKGTREAWSSDMEVASRRTRQRVFGWWLAYPWGVLEATTESAVRLLGGIPVGIAVSASAYTVVPIGYGAAPLVGSAGVALGQGTVWPLTAATWNTLVAPPLAVLGQRPAPERADGFWMKQVDDPRLVEITAVLDGWRQQFEQSGASRQRDEGFLRIEKSRNDRVQVLTAEIKDINEQAEAERQKLRQQWLDQWLADVAAHRDSLDAALQARGVPLPLLVSQRPAVVEALVKRQWRKEDASRLLDALIGDRFRNVPQEPVRAVDDKSDPVKRALQVIEKP